MATERPAFTLGVEEEFQIVDPETRELRSHVEAIIEEGRRRFAERVKPELHQSVIELGTGICSNIQEVRRDVTELRTEIIRLAEQNGLRVGAAGTHPFSHWADQPITENPRYKAIVDELVAKRIELPFRYAEPLDVEWAGHPNWYFRWSKHALPHLDHPAVPKAFFVADLERPPDDLANWVLKPLFSFAGLGVKVDLSSGDLEAVPIEHRGRTLLMRKVEYAPVIETVDGKASKCELRMMYIWHRGAPLPVNTLARLSQGKMMGVDYNKDRTWVGSSSSMWPRS